MKKALLICIATLALYACNDKSKNPSTDTRQPLQSERIISLNGAITEVLVHLGEQKNLVGVDVTSSYPEDVKNTAVDLGHVRSLSIENIISLKPTVIFASNKDLNDELKSKIQAAGVKLELIEQEFSIAGTEQMITSVARAIDNDQAPALIDKLKSQIAQLPVLDPKPKVLFIYARGAGTLMVAGTETPIEKMIALAGGENAITEFSDYKPLTPESLINSNPDVILLFTTGLESLDGTDGVLKIDGIAQTKAGKNRKIIAMDGQLLSGFGPRVGQAITQLNGLLSN